MSSEKLHRVNFILLVLFGALCLFQWRDEKEARQKIGELQKARDEQKQKLAEQDESLRAANEDLAGFRTQVTTLKSQADDTSAQLRAQKTQLAQLTQAKAALAHQVETWQHGVDDYKAALEARDASLKTVIEQRDQLYAAHKASIERANQAVAALNDLNGKYFDVVTRYNTLTAQMQAQSQTAPPSDARN